MWGVALMVRVQGGYHQDSAAAARVWGDAIYPARVRVLLGAQGQMEDWATGTGAVLCAPCKLACYGVPLLWGSRSNGE